jgi:hypothetical protein
MKLSPATLLAAALLLTGCAAQPREHLAAVRAAGVSPGLVRKLGHRGVLSPGDIIELKRRNVTDAVALRQLNRVGVNYLVGTSILDQFRTAGVSDSVSTAVVTASRKSGMGFRRRDGLGWNGSSGHPYSPSYYDRYELDQPSPPRRYFNAPGPYMPDLGPLGGPGLGVVPDGTPHVR